MGGLPAEKTVYAVASHPAKPQVIYAAVRNGIYRSSDGGKTWEIMKRGPSGVVAIAVHPERPEVLYAATAVGAVFRSEDGGTNWRQQTEALQGKKR